MNKHHPPTQSRRIAHSLSSEDQIRRLTSGCEQVDRTDSVVLSHMMRFPSTLPVALYGITDDMCAVSMESV
jgi:hypothetical protein